MACNEESLSNSSTEPSASDQICHGEELPFGKVAERLTTSILTEPFIEEFHQDIHEAQKRLIDHLYEVVPNRSLVSLEIDQDLDKLELAVCKIDEAKMILSGLSVDTEEPKEEKKDSDWNKILADSKKAVTDCIIGVICVSFLGYAVLTSFTMSTKVWWMLPLLAVLCAVLVLTMGRVTVWSMNRKLKTTKGTVSDILCSTCFARKFASEETVVEKKEGDNV
jgi:uncharacterized membrane protein YeaQ/YmgE (transglycosylase-associated protein family)